MSYGWGLGCFHEPRDPWVPTAEQDKVVDAHISGITYKGRGWTAYARAAARVTLYNHITGSHYKDAVRWALRLDENLYEDGGCSGGKCRPMRVAKKKGRAAPRKIAVIIKRERGSNADQYTGLTPVFVIADAPGGRALGTYEVMMRPPRED